jgi:flagellar hook-associated protein 1 FlgK
MSNIFNSLNIGYSGLVAAQAAVDTTSHNISNAETEGYTRQRVVTSASTPLTIAPGQVGNGVDVTDITRVYDNFVFEKYTGISADKEYADYMENTLSELSTYFPEIDGVGIKADLQEYYNMWQSLSDNPDNESIKLALATQTEKLTDSINSTQNQIMSLQESLNDQLAVNIDEVNTLAQELADINKSIEIAEAGGAFTANDLRDKRGMIELDLAKLIGAEVHLGGEVSNINTPSVEPIESYTLSVNGFNIVDGSTYHPLHVESNSANGFYELSYESQDGSLISIAEKVTDGRVGAILELRGSRIEDTTSGVPTNGVLQNVVAQFDSFAQGIIENTNNLYAQSPQTSMQSNYIQTKPNDSMMSSGLNVNTGSFDIVVYDIDGNVASSRTINIDQLTSLSGAANSNSIEGQITAQKDDNGDGNALNDIDDFISYNYASYASGDNAIEFTMDPAMQAKGYTFSIVDNFTEDDYNSGSNFAGALGMNRYFDGNDAGSMELNFHLKNNTTDISAGTTPVTGDNSLAMGMVQQQFERYDFKVGDSTEYNSTIYGMFDIIATGVGVETNRAILNNETVTAQFNAVEQEYASVSQVSIDEELTNLIRFQTAYGAASKIITTIDQMTETLLGIKR